MNEVEKLILMSNVKCPNCEKFYPKIGICQTIIAEHRLMKDNKIHIHDGNSITGHCICNNCSANFEIKIINSCICGWKQF
jgi:hypothetical protein